MACIALRRGSGREAVHHAPSGLCSEINARSTVGALAGAARCLRAIAPSSCQIALQSCTAFAVALARVSDLRTARDAEHSSDNDQQQAAGRGDSHGVTLQGFANESAIALRPQAGSSVATLENAIENAAASAKPARV